MTTARRPQSAIPAARSASGDPWQPLSRRGVRRLIRYLVWVGGEDTYEFCDQEGAPDVPAAHRFAEQMRAQLGPFCDTQVVVGEWEHCVTIYAAMPPFV